MRWVHAEYLLKGIFLGLLAYATVANPTKTSAGICFAGMAVGAVAALAIGWASLVRQGFRPAGRVAPFVVFLMLERPRYIFAGIYGGLLSATIIVRRENVDPKLLLMLLAAGIVLGLGFAGLPLVRNARIRLGAALAVAVGLVAAAIWWQDAHPESFTDAERAAVGICLLLGLPFFYLLTFVSEAEESEAEIITLCAALAIAIWFVNVTPGLPALALVLPLALCYVYIDRLVPHLRGFKCTLRGLGYAHVGRHGDALETLRRALELNVDNRLARESLWEVHRDLNAAQIAADPRLATLIDPHLCLDRVTGLLSEPPNKLQLAESTHLLDLVIHRDPGMLPVVMYWRAVAAMHQKDIAAAANYLNRLLDAPADSVRKSVLFKTWNLVAGAHSELDRRVAQPQLAISGRRMEAIAAVERVVADAPNDSEAWGLKRVLYAGLTQADVNLEPFDAAYVEQLGLALVDDAQRFRRGVEYLAIAAGGMPAESPKLWSVAADALEKHGDSVGAAQARKNGLAAGREVGHKKLSEPVRQCFFGLAKRLAEDAAAGNDLQTAVSLYQLLTESDRSGIETLRTLAELHERRGDALAALHAVESARVFNPKDADLNARREKYYYSVTPAQLQNAPENYRAAVDVDYCLTKAKQLLELKEIDVGLLEWAKHLTDLACALRPTSIVARVTAARVRLPLGERDHALQLLEDVREQKPAKFATSADEECWQLSNKLLGELYLNELDRPDLAAVCFADFRTSSKSGADTLYKLGLAHERLGDRPKAAKFYEQVTTYTEHPLAPDAREALLRVRP